jgi:hypothetical protein
MRLGIAPILKDQVGGAYVLEIKGPYGMAPSPNFLAQLADEIVAAGEGNRISAANSQHSSDPGYPYGPIDARSSPLLPPGHIYTTDPPILDGRLAGLLSARAYRVALVSHGIDLDMGESGTIGLRLLSLKVGPLNLLPEQVGAAFSVDLSRLSPENPELFSDLVTSLVEMGEAKRVELRSITSEAGPQ